MKLFASPWERFAPEKRLCYRIPDEPFKRSSQRSRAIRNGHSQRGILAHIDASPAPVVYGMRGNVRRGTSRPPSCHLLSSRAYVETDLRFHLHVADFGRFVFPVRLDNFLRVH